MLFDYKYIIQDNMHIWTIRKWEKYFDIQNHNHRKGVRIKFDKHVDSEVKRACKEFLAWLRTEYFFPVRVPIYVKSAKMIKARDGDMVYGTFLGPYDKKQEPSIRIATGDFLELQVELGKDSALSSILWSMAHELTHYFQWINNIELTERGTERQANAYAGFILDEYKDIKDHP